MKLFYKRNLTFDEKVRFSYYSNCENNSKYILHLRKLIQQKVFCFCYFSVDYTGMLTLRTFQKRRFRSWTWVLPNSKNDKPNSIMISMYTVLAVVTVSFPQMKISRTKICIHRFSNVKIMVTFVTLDLYLPVYQIEFISCRTLAIFKETFLILKFTTVL